MLQEGSPVEVYLGADLDLPLTEESLAEEIKSHREKDSHHKL